MSRQKELEICLSDIASIAVIPSSVNTHFSQICMIQGMAKDCLNSDEKYSDAAAEFKSKNECKLELGITFNGLNYRAN